MVEPHPLILSLRSAGLRDLDPCNVEEVHNMWQAFSKAKQCIDGGDRFEYLSWRIYSREVLLRKHVATAGQVGAAQSAVLRDSDENEESAENEETSSESDWESDSDGSVTSGSDETQSLTRAPLAYTSDVKMPLSAVKPDKAHAPLSYGYPHRRISSAELQSLFNETHKPMSARTIQSGAVDSEAGAEFGAESARDPINLPKKTIKSCLKKSSSTSPEPNNAIHHARFASPQFNFNSTEVRPSSRSYNEPNDDEKGKRSSVVRGFSPSNVSVSVATSRTGVTDLPQNNEQSSDDSNDNEEKHVESDVHQSASDQQLSKLTAAAKEKNRANKMFYICAGDSDTESSNMGSPDSHPPTHNDDENSWSTEMKHGNNNMSAGGKAHVDTDAEDDDFDENDTGSEWDDISEDEDSDDADAEERRRDMFKERAVPTNPLLKRSLLSSLFVNKVKDSDLAPKSGEGNGHSESPVSAPVDILLGAPVAPHFPLPVERFDDGADTSDFNGIHISDGGISQNQQGQQGRQLSSLVGTHSPIAGSSSTHILSRPEMYRASTDTSDRRRSSNDFPPTANWAHQHEDIYDPMNYHSRGW